MIMSRGFYLDTNITAVISWRCSIKLMRRRKMDSYTAVGIAEGFIDAECEEQILEAWQHLIDTGLCWRLQGWFSRQAIALINDGACHE